jgi:hypothetical protein
MTDDIQKKRYDLINKLPELKVMKERKISGLFSDKLELL